MPSCKDGWRTLIKAADENLISERIAYVNSKSVLKFSCLICKKEYAEVAGKYKRNKQNRYCLEHRPRLLINSPEARAWFISVCSKIHNGRYLYDRLPTLFNMAAAVPITCTVHGVTLQQAWTHKNGMVPACCRGAAIHDSKRTFLFDYINRVNKIHDFKYDYSEIIFKNMHSKLRIRCPLHGFFVKDAFIHLKKDFGRCPFCAGASQPVKSIQGWLQRRSVVYEKEKRFITSIEGTSILRFDFYLPEYALCVEYDGLHHFKPVRFGTMSRERAEECLKVTQAHDHLKNKMCQELHINLLRIPYTEKNPDAFLCNYLKKRGLPRFSYFYTDVEEDCERLCSYIDNLNLTDFVIYSIARGGLVPGVVLANYYKKELGILNYQRYDSNSKKVIFGNRLESKDLPIILVDDLIDGLVTMDKCVNFLKWKFKKSDIYPMTLLGYKNSLGVYYAREKPDKWVIFPWEAEA